MIGILQAIKRRLTRHRVLIAKYKDPKTIFIYQMGKVGSTSLEHGISNGLHVHAFYSRNHTCPVRLQGLAQFGVQHLLYRAEQEVMAYLLRNAFRRRKQTRIITLVREPMTRNMSMFFHDIDAYLFAAHTNCMNTRNKPLATRLQDMALLSKVYEQEFNHHYPLNWFQQEFLPMTGINIFDYPFDTHRGMVLIKSQKIQVLCIRTDKIQDSVDELSQFVGQEVELTKKNNAEAKWYGDIYVHFKQQYQLPKTLESHIRESKLYQHFFVNDQ